MKLIKFFVGVFFSFALLLTCQGKAMAYSSNDQDCSKCHTLSMEEAKSLLNPIIPDVKVIDIRIAPVKSLWEISLEAKGQKGIAYIEFSKDKAIFGEVVKIKTQESLTRQRLSELNRVDFSQIPLEDALVMGDLKAAHKVVVFDDPDWPFCAKLHQEMKQVLEKRKDIAFFIKLYPLKMHQDAYRKAKAIQCEKSLQLLEAAFEKRSIPDPTCKMSVIANPVDNTIRLAEKLGINGTPAMIFENGTLVSGMKKADEIVNLVDSKK